MCQKKYQKNKHTLVNFGSDYPYITNESCDFTKKFKSILEWSINHVVHRDWSNFSSNMDTIFISVFYVVMAHFFLSCCIPLKHVALHRLISNRYLSIRFFIL